MIAVGIVLPTGASLASHTERGVSDDFKAINELVRKIEEDIDRSVFLGKPYEDAKAALYFAVLEASHPNWNGYGARMVQEHTYESALRFLRSLPKSVPPPEVSVEPDGEIAFDWHLEGVGTFSVSVGPSSVLNYAGLFGRNKVHGTEYWGDEIPKPIIDNLARLYSFPARCA